MKEGYWNGEPTAIFKVVLYKPGRSSNKNHWQNMFVDQTRQGVLITYEGATWLIDNEHGDGYHKVTNGMGSPQCGHKSVEEHTIVGDLREEKWQKEYDLISIRKESAAHDEWMKVNSPEDWKQIVSLRELIRKSRV